MELLDSLIYANIDQRAYYINKQGQAVYTPVTCVVLESSVRVCEENTSRI